MWKELPSSLETSNLVHNHGRSTVGQMGVRSVIKFPNHFSISPSCTASPVSFDCSNIKLWGFFPRIGEICLQQLRLLQEILSAYKPLLKSPNGITDAKKSFSGWMVI